MVPAHYETAADPRARLGRRCGCRRPRPSRRKTIPFTTIQNRLRQLGATYYLLGVLGGQQQRYRFYCKMAVGGNPNYTPSLRGHRCGAAAGDVAGLAAGRVVAAGRVALRQQDRFALLRGARRAGVSAASITDESVPLFPLHLERQAVAAGGQPGEADFFVFPCCRGLAKCLGASIV